MIDWLLVVAFLLPPYLSNAVPVIFGGGEFVDFGKTFIDGRRLFGDGKTWRGLFSGILFGSLIAYLEYLYFADLRFFYLGFLTSIGAMLGDLIGSFIKRRLGMGRGAQSIFMDQLLFIIMAYFLSYPILSSWLKFLLDLKVFMMVLIVTYVMHRGSNLVANIFGLKKVPW